MKPSIEGLQIAMAAGTWASMPTCSVVIELGGKFLKDHVSSLLLALPEKERKKMLKRIWKEYKVEAHINVAEREMQCAEAKVSRLKKLFAALPK